ncbi:MAG: CooT family nickel-binding protein [Promethearchaeati archaeon SRVP18_Atabeyarchaeia-1]
MCEFTVYDKDDPSKRIAEDIVKATMKNGCLTIRKVLGDSMTLENAVILEVDVSKEQMIISRLPFLGDIAKLVELFSNYRKDPSPTAYQKIVSQWEQAKSEGDSAVRSLKNKN